MTYEEEINKSNHEFWLDIKKYIFEKVILGAFIGLIAYIAYFQFEEYKGDIVKGRFLLEKRLSALTQIRDSYSNLDQSHSDFMVALHEDSLLTDEQKREAFKEYQDNLESFSSISNRHLFLFTKKFGNSLSYHYIIHTAMASGSMKIEPNEEMWKFSSSISENFEEITRRALHNEALSEDIRADNDIFRFPDISNDKIIEIQPVEFFDMVMQKWRNE